MGHPLSLGRTRNVHNTLFQLLYVDVQLTYRVLQLSNYFKVARGRGGGAQNFEIYNTIFRAYLVFVFVGWAQNFGNKIFVAYLVIVFVYFVVLVFNIYSGK